MSGDKYLNESLRWNERVSSLVSHLLVGLILTCLMITLVQFGEYLLPTWNGGYLPWATFVIALEAMYTKRAARSISILSREWATYRGVELVVLLLALRVLLFCWASQPGQAWVWTPGSGISLATFSAENILLQP